MYECVPVCAHTGVEQYSICWLICHRCVEVGCKFSSLCVHACVCVRVCVRPLLAGGHTQRQIKVELPGAETTTQLRNSAVGSDSVE